MGSNPKQAIGVVLFYIAWVLMAAGAAMDGSVPLIVAGIALLGGSAAVLIKAKGLEHFES